MSLLLFFLSGSFISKLIVIRFFRIHSSVYDLGVPAEGLFPGKDFNISLKITVPEFLLPGFHIIFSQLQIWQNRAGIPVVFPLSRGQNKKNGIFKAEKRGLYTGSKGMLIISDLLGLTRSTVLLTGSDKTVIYPELILPEEMVFAPIMGGLGSPKREVKVRNDEFFDIRKYYPGDDTKRINWKQFAHLNELFLRVNEEDPPPEAKIFFLLDTSSDKTLFHGTKEQGLNNYLDSVVSLCGGLISVYINSGIEVQFLFPGQLKPVTLSNGDEKDLLTILSGIWWDNSEEQVIPQISGMQTVILSVPGSGKLPALLKGLRKNSLYLYYKKPELFTEKEFSINIRNLLFIPGEKREKPVSQKTIYTKLLSDIRRYKSKSWGVNEIFEI